MSFMLERSKIEAAYVLFSVIFDMQLKRTPTVYQDIATVIPGVSERVEMKWLGETPTMKKWVGDRQFSKLRAESHTLRTEWWANGIETDVDDVNNDKFGLIPIRVQSLAQAAGARMDAEVVDLYINGFNSSRGLAYDGQFLYDTDHTAAGNGTGAAQTNLQTGALASANFNAALQKGLAFTDGEGEPLSINLSKVMTGTQNQLAARTLLQAQYQAGGATNIDANMAPWMIVPRITGTHWFLLADAVIRSVIVGIEVPVEFAAVDQPGSMPRFMSRKVLYGAHTKFGTCYGFWQNSVGSVG